MRMLRRRRRRKRKRRGMIMRMWINMMIMMRGIMRRVWIMIEDDGFNQLILFYRIHLKRSIIVFINENKDTNNDDNLIS